MDAMIDRGANSTVFVLKINELTPMEAMALADSGPVMEPSDFDRYAMSTYHVDRMRGENSLSVIVEYMDNSGIRFLLLDMSEED